MLYFSYRRLLTFLTVSMFGVATEPLFEYDFSLKLIHRCRWLVPERMHQLPGTASLI